MIRFEVKQLFFDSPKVVRAVDRTTRRVLSKFGAFVRRTARSSIRKRKRTSEPGSPPSSHTGLLKRFIFFGYDAQKRSVVIGGTITRDAAKHTCWVRRNRLGPKRQTDGEGSGKPMGPAFEGRTQAGRHVATASSRDTEHGDLCIGLNAGLYQGEAVSPPSSMSGWTTSAT